MIHRDLKPENILLFDENFDSVKLCDFGWAALAKDDQQRLTFCGTADYLAPEIAKGNTYHKEVDLWGCGILMFELMTGRAPFTGDDVKHTIQKIKDFKLTLNKEYESISEDAKDLIS